MLSVRNINVNYGAVTALKNCSLEVNEGEIVCLLGSNGAGKTSLMRVLSGLHPVKSGEIFFNQKAITNARSDIIVKLGISQSPEGRMVFQDMTVKNNLLMGAFHRNKAKKQEIQTDLKEVLSLFPRLEERLEQKAILLSGGEQQMLAIGRALMAKPRFLLLDEPSLGIAPLIVEQILVNLKKLNNNGISILLAEQNAHMALKISHRAYVLELGQVVREGKASEMLVDDSIRKTYLGIT